MLYIDAMTTPQNPEHQYNDHGNDAIRNLDVIRERAAAFAATWGTDQDLTTTYASATGCAWDDDR
jgi:hypothetical protein